MSEELKSCPFCGGKAKLRQSSDGDVEWVCCQSCGISGPLKLTTRDAIAAWNTRVGEKA